MKLIEFFRSPTYIAAALTIWLAGFLVMTSSQAHNNLSYLILIIPTLISLRVEEIKLFLSTRLARWLLLVIFSLVLATALADGDAMRLAKFGLIVIVFYLAISRFSTMPADIVYKAAWGFLVCILLYIICNMGWMYTHQTWQPGMRMGILMSKLENAIYITNTMGGMLAIITLLGLRQRKIAAVIAAHVLVLFFSLTILQTRSIIGIWLLILLLTAFSSDNRHSEIHYRKAMVFGGILTIMLLVWFALTSSIGEDLLSRKFYRLDAWQGFIHETLSCGIWLGCGSDHVYQHIAPDGFILVHPHSAYVTQFYKAGLVGFIPLLILTISACLYGIKQKSWAGWYFMVGALGLIFDGNSLIHSPSQRWLVFHLPLALIIAEQIHHHMIIRKDDHESHS